MYRYMHYSSNNMAAAAVVVVISTRTRYTHCIAILYTPEQRVHTAYNDTKSQTVNIRRRRRRKPVSVYYYYPKCRSTGNGPRPSGRPRGRKIFDRGSRPEDACEWITIIYITEIITDERAKRVGSAVEEIELRRNNTLYSAVRNLAPTTHCSVFPVQGRRAHGRSRACTLYVIFLCVPMCNNIITYVRAGYN